MKIKFAIFLLILVFPVSVFCQKIDSVFYPKSNWESKKLELYGVSNLKGEWQKFEKEESIVSILVNQKKEVEILRFNYESIESRSENSLLHDSLKNQFADFTHEFWEKQSHLMKVLLDDSRFFPHKDRLLNSIKSFEEKLLLIENSDEFLETGKLLNESEKFLEILISEYIVLNPRPDFLKSYSVNAGLDFLVGDGLDLTLQNGNLPMLRHSLNFDNITTNPNNQINPQFNLENKETLEFLYPIILSIDKPIGEIDALQSKQIDAILQPNVQIPFELPSTSVMDKFKNGQTGSIGEIVGPPLNSKILNGFSESDITIFRRIIDPDEMGIIDSLFKIASPNSISGYTQKISKVDSTFENLTFERDLKFVDKTYWDVLFSINPTPFILNQVSPALGFNLTDLSSIGMGPNIIFGQQERILQSLLGIRGFLRKDLIHRKFYLQLEDIIHKSKMAVPFSEEVGRKLQHQFSIGGGTRIKLINSVDLNLATMINLSKVFNNSGQDSIFLFRLGISTSK